MRIFGKLVHNQLHSKISPKLTNIFYKQYKFVTFVKKENWTQKFTEETFKNKAVAELTRRKLRRKMKKPKVIKKMSDDFEETWLDSLNFSNLKLYRKTSYGSFKVVNFDEILKKLKLVQESGTEKRDCKVLSQSETDGSTQKSADHQLATPYLPEFLISNMLDFPLIKESTNKSLMSVLNEENENFGIVDSKNLPSVTKILSETMSEVAKLRLKQWKNKMIEKLGKDGFYKHQEDLLRKGSKFHGCLKKYLSKDEGDIVIDPDIEGCWKSVESLLPEISDVLMVEESIHHPILMYKGVIDCVASYQGIPCVIEWKKSDKEKESLVSTYDAPLQLCAYLGALTWKENFTKSTLKNGLVVVAYSNGSPANSFTMDLECCQLYWHEWLRRLQSYWANRSSSVQYENESA